MSDNLQEQQDEVLALESILTDTGRLEVLDGPDVMPEHLYLIQIEIPVKLQDGGLTVELTLPGEDDVSEQYGKAADLPEKERPKIDRSVSGQHWHCSVRIQHLPPLLLHVSLPSTYPSKDPPNAQLTALWLKDLQIDSLQKELHQLWKESAGMPVLYTWVDWLENSVLSFLGITDKLLLQCSAEIDEVPDLEEDAGALPDDDDELKREGAETSDRKEHKSGLDEAFQEEGATASVPSSSSFLRRASIDLQTDLIYLVRYSMDRELQEFNVSVHECCICFCTRTGQHFVRLNHCRHHFCKDCAAAYCASHVKDGTVDSLKCPDPDCDTQLPPGLIRGVLDDEMYQRYEKITLQRALDKMSDVTWCPRCNQPAIKEEENMASCGHCYFVFCLKCKNTWHGGNECSSYLLDLQTFLEALKQGTKNKEEVLESFQKKLELVHGLFTVSSSSRPCPHCGVPIQKISGCNHMVCAHCNRDFSWTRARSSEVNPETNEYMSEAEGIEKLLVQGLLAKGYQLSQLMGDMQRSIVGLDSVNPSFTSDQQQYVPTNILKYPYRERHRQRNFNQTSCPECKQINLRKQASDVIRCDDCSSYVTDLQLLLEAVKQGRKRKECVPAAVREKLQLARGLVTIRSTSRPCSNCGVPIQKISGCNYMRCAHCKQTFLWDKANWCEKSVIPNICLALEMLERYYKTGT